MATGHEAPSPVGRRARRAAPPGTVEGPTLRQPLDDDLELTAEEESGPRADPRDEGVHAGTLTDGFGAPADAPPGDASARPTAPGRSDYFLAGS